MNDGILREANESRGPMFGSNRLVSMLDIIGGGTVTCDKCGRWQNISALGPEHLKEQMTPFGWTFPGDKDICPKCSKQKVKRSRTKEF